MAAPPPRAPIIAAMYAIAGTPTTRPAPSYAYLHRSSFNDIARNANGACGTALCRGAVGWDGPTVSAARTACPD